MNVKAYYKANVSCNFNREQQLEIIRSQTHTQLLNNLKNQENKLKENLFCKVNTKENVLKMIQLINEEIKN